MATNLMSEVIQQLRRALLLQDGAGLTDRQLLEDYISRRDEAAFAALVKRHGPMVWGVCRRVLRNYHDAEDAFQATFLVLVRKAASIASRDLLANWLYGVAHQTALKARQTAARRKYRETQVTQMPEPAVLEPDLWHDLQPLLDQELSRLPAKYRAVVVLCDLEGKTRKEASRQLSLPEGTVASRLATARTMLAKRLTKRGVVLSAAALGTLAAQKGAIAGVPTSVVSSTLRAATMLAMGQSAGLISVNVTAVMEGVLKTMLLTKLKIATAVLLVVGSLTGAAGLIYQTQAAEQPKPQRVNETPKAPETDKGLLGTWKAMKLKVNGEQDDSDIWLKDQPVTAITWTFDGNRVYIKGGDRSMVARYTQDSQTNPKQIDLTFQIPYPDVADVQQEITARGIYGVDDDTLMVCYIRGHDGLGRAFRPIKFEARTNPSFISGMPVIYYTFRREGSPAKKKDTD